jgi:uncharacterized membrane protein YgcG
MELATRKRPRRLLFVAAVIVLSAAIFAAVQAPLRAQEPPRITIVVNGERHFVSQQDLEAGSDKSGDFKIRSRPGATLTTQHVDKGMSLSKLLETARPRIRGAVRTIELKRANGSRYFVPRNADLVFFFVEGGRSVFLRELDTSNRDDVNKPDQGFGDPLRLRGRTGSFLDVKVTADPEKPRVAESVDFTADVGKALDGEKLQYDWDFGDGDTDNDAGASPSHTYKTRESFTVTVTVEGDKESVGVGSFKFRARKKAPPPSNSGGGSSGSGSSGGGSGGGGSSGGSGGGAGGGVPGGTAPFNPGTTPPNSTTPALPPPASSPPSGDTGRGPNLDPNAPPAATTEPGQEVTGILVSAKVAPKPGQKPGAKAPNAAAKQAAAADDSFDWKLAGGIALTALLVILGALHERRPIRRLLPQAQ